MEIEPIKCNISYTKRTINYVVIIIEQEAFVTKVFRYFGTIINLDGEIQEDIAQVEVDN